jgi:hypothetical protein
MSYGGKVILLPLLLLTLVALAMEGGVWRKYITITGPFAAETDPPQHSLMLSVPNQSSLPWWQQPLNWDSLEKPYESRLHLSIDSQAMWPPHSKLDLIRKGETQGFSHWESGVIFALPPGVKNSPETVVTLRYNVKPRPWVTIVLLAATLSLGWSLFHEPAKQFARRNWDPASPVRRSVERLAAVLLPVPYLILFGLCCLGLAGSVAFVGSSLYALANGWALPTTAPIRWSPIAEWAARNEPYFGQLLVTLAGFGTLTTWLSVLCVRANQSIGYELKLRTFLSWCGPPITICAYAICVSAMWDGMLRPGDFHGANIGGLIPFSDAHGYLAAAFDQARDGTWTSFAARRPLAAAFRSVLILASDYSFALTLMLQCVLLALATCLASYAVMVTCGIWAAVAFFGLTYIYVRIFAPTSLTEPLGLFWALLSIPFFLQAFRLRSPNLALLGFAMTAIALMTRMGSMFTIPALLLWLVWQFGEGAAARFRTGLLATAVLVGILGINAFIQKAYGTPGGETGANFAYTICGLSMGTAWDGCPKELAEQGEPLSYDETTVAKKLYAFAWQNFRDHPQVLLRRLRSAATTFVARIPDLMWSGYGGAAEPRWLLRMILSAIVVIGLFFLAIRGVRAVEIAFWTLVWTSIIASSAVVYFDDGLRVLAVSQPLMALFFATGMGNPAFASGQAVQSGALLRYGVAGLIATAVLFASAPWVAHRLWSTKSAVDPMHNVNEALVAGGRRMSGFLIVADGTPRRSDIPSLHFSDFEAIVAQSDIENYQGLLHPVAPDLPFGFVFAARLERGVASALLFIVPAYVTEHRDVSTWCFQLEPWQHKADAQGVYWSNVRKAEPCH